MQQCEMLCFEKPNGVVKTDIGWRQSIGALLKQICKLFAEKIIIGENINVRFLNKNESFLETMLSQNANNQGTVRISHQSATGIAGYTLIYDSHSLNLAEHKPFVEGEYGNTPTIHLVEKLEQRANIADTDRGKEINVRIHDLHLLLEAYKAGLIK